MKKLKPLPSGNLNLQDLDSQLDLEIEPLKQGPILHPNPIPQTKGLGSLKLIF